MKNLTANHDTALALARQAMLVDSASGVAIGAWREGVLTICKMCDVPEPPDVLAWVSGGKASDKQVNDWESTFGVQ